MAALDARRIPCAPVLTLNEAMAHPHLRDRGTVRTVRDEAIGEFEIPGFPTRFSAWQPPRGLRAAALGEDNEEVLEELLGLSQAEVQALYEDEVLVRDPLLRQRTSEKV